MTTKQFTSPDPDTIPDFTFKLDDDTITAYGDVPAGALLKLGAAAALGDEGGGEALVAMESFIALALHEESAALIQERMNSKDRKRRLTLDTVSDMVQWLAGIYGGEDAPPTE